jgi:hypothetical protein
MRIFEKEPRSPVGRGSANHAVTNTCHSPWRHPTVPVPNGIAAALFVYLDGGIKVRRVRSESVVLLDRR